jgi:hypothetical protein
MTPGFLRGGPSYAGGEEAVASRYMVEGDFD